MVGLCQWCSAIDALEAEDKANGGKPRAQGVLADNLTELVHGKEELQRIKAANELLFGGDVQQLPDDMLAQLKLDVIPALQTIDQHTVVDILVELDLVKSRRQARDMINSGAVSINGQTIMDEHALLEHTTPLHQNYWLIRKGKKHYGLCHSH